MRGSGRPRGMRCAQWGSAMKTLKHATMWMPLSLLITCRIVQLCRSIR